MFAYLKGTDNVTSLETTVKNYKKAVKAHHRISEIQLSVK